MKFQGNFNLLGGGNSGPQGPLDQLFRKHTRETTPRSLHGNWDFGSIPVLAHAT